MSSTAEDKLNRIFRLQKEYNDMVFENFHRKNPTQESKISAICTAMIHEVVEMQRLTSWKWWKKPEALNLADAKEELIDIQHFVTAAAIFLEMTPEEFTREYERKNQINRDRVRDGY